MRIVMPSTSCGVYSSVGMKRMGGEGLRKDILKVKDDVKKIGGSFLLDGGAGGQNSYSSLSDYTATTVRKGKGLEKLTEKISNLSIIPKKQKSMIKFDM
jgi:hypothetical protein